MKKGFACGVFDLFHAGHVLMLRECKQHCDYLVVAVNEAGALPEGKNTPVFGLKERVLVVSACRFVDEVMTYRSEDELRSLMERIKPDIRFLGEDYRNKPITGADLGIPIRFIDRSHGLSTSGIISMLRQKR